MHDILKEIIDNKRIEVEQAKKDLKPDELIRRLKDNLPRTRNFRGAISRPDEINIIAEIKKASPVAGILRGDFDAAQIAAVYQASGACAISVLTDKKFFQGEPAHLEQAKRAVNLPVLRKDFIIDIYQLYESAMLGADCILLIAELLSEKQLRDFIVNCDELGIDALVEANCEDAIHKVLSAQAKIIGINNRDLTTFQVDIENTARLIKLIPDGKTVVSESGIKTFDDVMYLKGLGVDAVLIGEAFMRSPDIAAKMRELKGIF